MSTVSRFWINSLLMAVPFALLATALSAADIHVAPGGKSDGDGTRAKPYDLATVFAGKGVQPGDTVLLKGGRYDGAMTNTDKGIPSRVPFEPKLKGSPDKPIIVTSAPGEWAHLNGTVQITDCDYTHFVRLEIGDLDWDPMQEKHVNDTAVNATKGQDVKLVNCNVFGGTMGIGAWSSARGLELYGNLIHDFGYLVRDPSDPAKRKGRGHGHAYYAQNEDGTKVFQNNIAYRGCGWNVHIYTQGGQIRGFDVIENICYIAGAFTEGQTMDNYLVYGKPPADRIRLIGNVGYQPSDAEKWRPNARLANVYDTPVNGVAVVQDNYLMGAFWGLSLAKWRDITVTGNRIWCTGVFMEISSAGTGSGAGVQPDMPDLKGYHVDKNTYIDNGRTGAFYYGNKESKKDDELIGFAQWQALGLDKGSTLQPGKNGRPAGAKTFVFPNRYEKGRANVAIFAWDGQPSVDVDLSTALADGRRYKIYNCLDVNQTLAKATPVLAGSLAGSPSRSP